MGPARRIVYVDIVGAERCNAVFDGKLHCKQMLLYCSR